MRRRRGADGNGRESRDGSQEWDELGHEVVGLSVSVRGVALRADAKRIAGPSVGRGQVSCDFAASART